MLKLLHAAISDYKQKTDGRAVIKTSRTFQSSYPTHSHKYTRTNNTQQKRTQVPPSTFHKHISPIRLTARLSLSLWTHSTCEVRQSARGHHVLRQRCYQLFTSESWALPSQPQQIPHVQSQASHSWLYATHNISNSKLLSLCICVYQYISK